jgi:adenine-specific DNA-methyltransferase
MPQKLELTWIGKNDPKHQISPEPRILIPNEEYSYGDPNTENMLIQGDNLLALKSLEQEYAGRIKCVYIDPPYNTGSAFEHYDDNLEHSTWLNLMKPRLELLRNLLSEEGSIWISIDDDEQAYLKVLCDEVFGRSNFVSNVIWEKKYSPQNDAKWLSDGHDFIVIYAKNKDLWRPNLLPRGEKQNKYYKYDDGDGRGVWRSDNVLVKTFSQSGVFGIKNPNTGEMFYPPEGSCYRFNEETAKRLLEENRLYFGKDGKGAPQYKRYLSEVKQGVTSLTLWKREDVGDNQEAKNEAKVFNTSSIFATPKPERLIQQVLFLASNEGDLVLDSFLGSGTTAAVALKMNRHFIGIELGNHAYTHCYPRLKAVVDGEQGGISKSISWNGGGGFKFYELAPSLLKEDKYGNLVTDETYNSEMLAEAMTKHQNFKYDPDPDVFWKQGYSYEKDFIFTTTQFVTHEFLDLIHQDMADDESLLICCKAFAEGAEMLYENIDIKKIPLAILDKCEFGRDNYSLNVFESTEIDEDPDDIEII